MSYSTIEHASLMTMAKSKSQLLCPHLPGKHGLSSANKSCPPSGCSNGYRSESLSANQGDFQNFYKMLFYVFLCLDSIEYWLRVGGLRLL